MAGGETQLDMEKFFEEEKIITVEKDKEVPTKRKITQGKQKNGVTRKEKKVDGKREKKGVQNKKGVVSDDAAFELAKQKEELEKIERKRQKQEARSVKIEAETADISEPKKAADNITSVEETVEIKAEDKTGTGDNIQETGIKTLENKKASLEGNLETLRDVFEASKKRDPNFSKELERDASLDDPEETKRRAKIGIKITDIRNKISGIDAEIKELSKKSDIDVDTEETAEARKPKKDDTLIVKDSADWDKLVGQREWEKLIAKNKAEKLTKKDSTPDIKSAKNDQIVEMPDDLIEKDSNFNSNPLNLKNMEKENHEDVSGDLYKISPATLQEFLQEQEGQKVEKENDQQQAGKEEKDIKPVRISEKNRKETEKEVMKELEKKRSLSPKNQQKRAKEYEEILANQDTVTIEAQKNEIAELKKSLENAEKLEGKLVAMEAEIKRQEIQIEQSKNPTFVESIKKYWKDPKVKGIVIGALVGVGAYTLSGGTAPIYFALKTALGYKSLFIPAYLGHGFSTWGTLAAAGGFAGYVAEKLGFAKGEKSDREKRQEGLEKLKNIGNEQHPASEISAEAPAVGETPAETPPETPAKETEDTKDQRKKDDDKIDIIGGSGSEKLTPEEKEEMRKIAEKRGIDIISPSAGTKNDKGLIKKPEGMKKNAPETETNEEDNEALKEARRVGIIDNIVKDFKAKKITGEDLLRFSAQIALWMREAKDSGKETAENAIIEKIISSGLADDNSNLQGEVINAMIEHAKKEKFYKKNKKEVINAIFWLTLKNKKEEILKVKGISAETKNWLENDVVMAEVEQKTKEEIKSDKELFKNGTSQEIFDRNVEKVKDDYKKFEKARSYEELRKIVEDIKAGLISRQDANLIPSTYDMYLSILDRNILESQEKSALERIKEDYATGAYGYRPSNTKNVRTFFDKIIELNEARDAKKK